MFRIALLTIMLLAMSPGALAADGDAVDRNDRAGRRNPMFILCDNKVAADQGQTCGEFTSRYPADTYIFSVDRSANCTSWAVSVQDRALADGDLHEVVELTDTSFSEVRVYGPLTERIVITLTTLTGCTNFTLTLELIYDED